MTVRTTSPGASWSRWPKQLRAKAVKCRLIKFRLTHDRRLLLAVAAALLATQFSAKAAAQAPAPPKLLVVISVDQFSANLFDEYRPQFTAGMARLASGTVFHNGFQSHSMTETCPGHSTILTGDHP